MRSKNVVDLRGRRSALSLSKGRAATSVRIAKASNRTSPLRVKRRRVRMLASIACVALVVGAVFGLSYASYLPKYTVHSFAVQGMQAVPAHLIARFVDTQLNPPARPFFSHTNILLYDPRRLQTDIVDFFPRIKSAVVSRDSMLATAITVTIQERKEFARWCRDAGVRGQSVPSDCYSIDESGFVFAQVVATSTSNGPIFSGGFATSTHPIGRFFAHGHFPGILALFDQLSQIGLTPAGASVDDYGTDLTVFLTQGFDIKASFGQDPALLIRNLQLILSADVLRGREGDIQYIDLRFGDRAYYKLKSGPAVSQSATSTASH